MRRPRLLAGPALLFLLLSAAAAAQRPPAVITGRVVVLDSARSSQDVLVRIESARAGVWTDSTGRYRLVVPSARFVDGDSVTFTASRRGLAPHAQRIQLTAGAKARIDLRMKASRFAEDDPCYGLMFGTPASEEIRPAIFYEKLCRVSHAVRRRVRARSSPG